LLFLPFVEFFFRLGASRLLSTLPAAWLLWRPFVVQCVRAHGRGVAFAFVKDLARDAVALDGDDYACMKRQT
jgi:hypothetical protein